MSKMGPSFEGFNPGSAGPRYQPPVSGPPESLTNFITFLLIIPFYLGFLALVIGWSLIKTFGSVLRDHLRALLDNIERYAGLIGIWAVAIQMSALSFGLSSNTTNGYYISAAIGALAIYGTGRLFPELHLIPWRHGTWGARIPLLSYLYTVSVVFQSNELQYCVDDGNLSWAYARRTVLHALILLGLIGLGAAFFFRIGGSGNPVFTEQAAPAIFTLIETVIYQVPLFGPQIVYSSSLPFPDPADLVIRSLGFSTVVIYALVSFVQVRHRSNRDAERQVDRFIEKKAAQDREDGGAILRNRARAKAAREQSTNNPYRKYVNSPLIVANENS